MLRRKAIKILVLGVLGYIGITFKKYSLNLSPGMAADFRSTMNLPSPLLIDLGEIKEFHFTYKGKTKIIPIQDIWDII